MKTRQGFVSNSSSSSFILLFKAPQVCPTCGVHNNDFLEYIKARGESYSDTEINATGFDEVLERVKGGMFYDKDNPEIKRISDIIEKTKIEHPDWTAVYLDISYHDEAIKSRINNMIIKGQAEKVYESES